MRDTPVAALDAVLEFEHALLHIARDILENRGGELADARVRTHDAAIEAPKLEAAIDLGTGLEDEGAQRDRHLVAFGVDFLPSFDRALLVEEE